MPSSLLLPERKSCLVYKSRSISIVDSILPSKLIIVAIDPFTSAKVFKQFSTISLIFHFQAEERSALLL